MSKEDKDEIVITEKNIPGPSVEVDQPTPVPLRMFGTFIDFCIVLILGSILSTISSLAFVALAPIVGTSLPLNTFISLLNLSIGGAYLLFRDGIFGNGQSIGKFLVGYKVIGPNGENCTLGQSARRNITLVVWQILAFLGSAAIFLPIHGPFVMLILYIMAAIAALSFTTLETATLIWDKNGKRLGDRYARTKLRSRTWRRMELPPTHRPRMLKDS